MALSNTFANDLAKLVFQGTPIAGLADNAASAPLSALWVALHTADPGAGGAQSASELAYTEYTRVQVVRSSSGWTVSGNEVSPVAPVEFPMMEAAGAGGTVTHWSVGTLESGAGKILIRGTVTPSLAIEQGDTPRLLTGTKLTLLTAS